MGVALPLAPPTLLSADALEKNQELEFERNKERFLFLKWGAKALKNMLIVPPGSGIVHQVGEKRRGGVYRGWGVTLTKLTDVKIPSYI